jgi:hypothetical protein
LPDALARSRLSGLDVALRKAAALERTMEIDRQQKSNNKERT